MDFFLSVLASLLNFLTCKHGNRNIDRNLQFSGTHTKLIKFSGAISGEK
jgi:hypothetical protein